MTNAGGWKEYLDGTVTPELRNYFEQALSGLVGVGYEPVSLLATQLVNGTNYKFLAVTKGEKVNKIIVINVNSNGEAKLVSIED